MKGIRQYLGFSGSTQESRRIGNQSELDDLDRQARYLAEQIASGFQLHDRRQRGEALEAFYAVDRGQFDHLTDEDARRTAEAFVDALWTKDDIEKTYHDDGEIDPGAIESADYDPVIECLERRARIAGMDQRYADRTAEAWKRHKTGGEYWTSFLKAQTYEVRAAMQDPDYPDKPKEGLSGYGPLPARYILSVELHDQHRKDTWEEAIRVMTPYYREILEAHRGRR